MIWACALGKCGIAVALGGYVGLGKTGVLTSPYDTLSVTLVYGPDVGSVYGSAIWSPGITCVTPLSRKAAIGVFRVRGHRRAQVCTDVF